MPKWLTRIINLGVGPTMPLTELKYIRAANLCAFVATVISLAIVPFEAFHFSAKVVALRTVGSLPFLATLGANARGRYRLGRIFLVGWASGFMVCMTLITGNQTPSHLGLIVVGMVSFAIFPRNEARTMWVMTVACAGALALALWARTQFEPMIEIPEESQPLADGIAHLVIFGTMVLVAYIQRRTTEIVEDRVAAEQNNSERLLLNILPEKIARRLKEDPHAIAERHPDVTVLFADIVGFTRMASGLEPQVLVSLLHRIVTKFDLLTAELGLEKIKTIGDCYMVASGVPAHRGDHAEAAAELALRMVQVLSQFQGPEGQVLDIRVGMASGPLVAGVIGEAKFAYDLWGDTVNIASRMESQGRPGHIQINETAYEKLKGIYAIEALGEVEIKGKGPMKTYHLVGRTGASGP